MSDLKISISEIKDGVVTVINLEGKLDGLNEQLLLTHATEVYDKGAKYILLDLTNLNTLTSAGLRAIQKIFKMVTPATDVELMHQHGDEPYKSPYLKVVCPNPQIYYVLNITGFLQNLYIFNNLEEAANSFGE